MAALAMLIYFVLYYLLRVKFNINIAFSQIFHDKVSRFTRVHVDTGRCGERKQEGMNNGRVIA